MVKGGTAATSDLDNVRAERLSVEQQNGESEATKANATAYVKRLLWSRGERYSETCAIQIARQ